MMMFWNELRLLHEHLPYPLLKLWGSSERLVSLSRYLAMGGKKTYIQCCKLLEDMEDWSLNRIYEFQFERLKKLLEHAYNNVPYYQETFNKECLKPSDIKCLEDLQKLPIVTKDDILANYKKFFAKNLWYRRKIRRDTSGTSGKALRVCIDKGALAAHNATSQYFRKIFLGYTKGKDVTLHTPFPVSGYTWFFLYKDNCSGFYSPVAKMVFFSWHFAVGDKAFKKYVELIKRFDIKHVEGSAYLYFAFAKYLANKDEYVKIKTALLVGEVLYGFQRKFIEKYLGCEVFNRYGQTEATISACECRRHNGLHIFPLGGVTEIKNHGLKGKGELVTTGLWNYTWPLIRYNIRDVAVLSQKKCGCGCAFPRLMSIEGRSNDFIVLPGGNYLSPLPFMWFNISVPMIKDIFFLQNKDYSLDIFVVKKEKGDANKIKRVITRKVKKILKNQLKVNIIFTKYIERKSRKYKVVETKINQEFSK